MSDFEIIDTKEIFSGRIVSLSVEKILLPGGREAEREVVRHPGAVAMVPMLAADEVVLIRQFRYCTKDFLWEIPAGTIEPGETPEDCARRELEEEIGYRPGRLESLGAFYTSPGFCDELIHLFLATDLEPCRSEPDADEILEAHRLSFEEALKKIGRGDIVDAKTIVGLLRVSGIGGDKART